MEHIWTELVGVLASIEDDLRIRQKRLAVVGGLCSVEEQLADWRRCEVLLESVCVTSQEYASLKSRVENGLAYFMLHEYGACLYEINWALRRSIRIRVRYI